MVNSHAVQVRVTKTQHEKMLLNARNRGFYTLSDYMRYAALEQDFAMDSMIRDIHKHLIDTPQKKSKKQDLYRRTR